MTLQTPQIRRFLLQSVYGVAQQTEELTEDKEKLLSENEKLEKQQKKLQQELNKMVQSKEVMERCHNFSKQPHHDFLLHIRHIQSIPFPIGSFQRHVSAGALMSAKAYRDKKALPLMEKLKEVVKNLTIKCVQLAEQSKRRFVAESSDTSCRIASPSFRICSVSCPAAIC